MNELQWRDSDANPWVAGGGHPSVLHAGAAAARLVWSGRSVRLWLLLQPSTVTTVITESRVHRVA